MALGCGQKILKYALFTFNLLCLIFGVTLVALAAVMLSRVGGLSQITFALDVVPIVLLLLGILSTIVSFFGCCGAIRQSNCLLYTYSVLLMVLLLAKGIMSIVALWKMDDLMADMQRYMGRMWQDRQREGYFWDKLQSTLLCCGLHGPSDWATSVVPLSCCAGPTLANTCPVAAAWPRGCSPVADNVLGDLVNAMAAIALVAAVIELTAFVFSCVLINGIRRQNRGRVF